MINTKRFDRVDQRKQQLDELRPLPPATARTLHEALVLEWTYHSNAIEGNTAMLRLRVEVNKFQYFIGQPIEC